MDADSGNTQVGEMEELVLREYCPTAAAGVTAMTDSDAADASFAAQARLALFPNPMGL